MYLAPEKVDVIPTGRQLPWKFLFAYCRYILLEYYLHVMFVSNLNLTLD